MASAAQAAASRLNGRTLSRSTSDEGKATSSLKRSQNRTDGRTVLLPSEDAALYEAHLAQFREQYLPALGRGSESGRRTTGLITLSTKLTG